MEERSDDHVDALVIFLFLWLGLTSASCVAKTYEPYYHNQARMEPLITTNELPGLDQDDSVPTAHVDREAMGSPTLARQNTTCTKEQ